jgi:hypothetical protein
VAYVVARANGRFEIRESVHTSKGPRARSLANFELLTDGVLNKAAGRSTRPFDPVAVLGSADRVGAPITPAARRASVPAKRSAVSGQGGAMESSDRPSRSKRQRITREGPDPGEELLELLRYVDQVSPFRADEETEPFLFPPLAALVAKRRSTRQGMP